jgi:SAM-dependent methyltransferase
LNNIQESPFDAYSSNYSGHVDRAIGFTGKTTDFYHRIKVDLLLSAAARFVDIEQSTVLDVGCGTGSLATLIAGKVQRLVGVDVSAPSIAEASKRLPACEFHTYDGDSLPLENDSMDLVFTSCVMHHVPPQDWMKFIAEMNRVVRPGGLVAIIEHNPWNPLTRVAVSSCEFDRDAVLLTRKTARRLLNDAGLTVQHDAYMIFFPWDFGFFRAIEAQLSWLPLGAQYFVVGQKQAKPNDAKASI